MRVALFAAGALAACAAANAVAPQKRGDHHIKSTIYVRAAPLTR